MSKTFTLEDVAFLTSDKGDTLLAKLMNEDLSDRTLINLIPKLRSAYSADETSAAIETVKLRRKAVDKFGDEAAQMLFTQDALEQASDPRIRQYRAHEDTSSVVDVCCSIGTDTLAFAQAGRSVTGVDIDPVRLAIAEHNAAVSGLQVEFVQKDVTQEVLPSADELFFDPARRDAHGNRLYDVELYQPPLSLIKRWEADYAPITVKLSPGVDVSQLESYNGSLRFYSVNGDLKEAELNMAGFAVPTAAVLFADDDSDPYIYQSGQQISDTAIQKPQNWLNEPDPAIIRAGYVQHFAQNLDGTMLDPTIAYFTTAQRPDSVWVRSWRVLDWMPFHLKKLRAYLKQRNIGCVTVKKRGSPITPEALQAKLKLKGDNSLTVVLTRLQGDPIVIICADYVSSPA